MKKYFVTAFLFLFVSVCHAQWTGVFNPGLLKKSSAVPTNFPVVQTTAINTTSAGPGVHTLPTGIASGDLLLFFMKMGSTSNYSLPVGWTSSYNTTISSTRSGMFYRIANGSEGSTLSVTTSPTAVTTQNSIIYRINGYQGTPESATASGTSTGATIDPPNLTPSWGLSSNLWIAMGNSVTTNGVSGTPTNYINSLGVAYKTSQRNLSAVSENPSAYTNASNVGWIAATIAIRGL